MTLIHTTYDALDLHAFIAHIKTEYAVHVLTLPKIGKTKIELLSYVETKDGYSELNMSKCWHIFATEPLVEYWARTCCQIKAYSKRIAPKHPILRRPPTYLHHILSVFTENAFTQEQTKEVIPIVLAAFERHLMADYALIARDGRIKK